MARVKLLQVAHARSGDKGDTANVGLIAYRPEYYPILVDQVTAERVKEHSKESVWATSSGLRFPICTR
jgi:hypothetical protein